MSHGIKFHGHFKYRRCSINTSLAAIGFTPLMVNLGHHEFFYGLGKRVAGAGELPHMGHDAALLQTSPQIFERCLVPKSPGRERGRMSVLHIQDAGE